MKLQMAVFIFSNILELYGLKCQPKVQKYGIYRQTCYKNKDSNQRLHTGTAGQ